MTLTSGPATASPMLRSLEAALGRFHQETGVSLARTPHAEMLGGLLNDDDHVVDLVGIIAELDADPVPPHTGPIRPRGQVAVGFAALAVGRLPRMIVSWQTGTLRLRYGGLIAPIPEISHVASVRFAYRGNQIDGYDVGSRLMVLLRDGEGTPVPRLPIMFSTELPATVVARWRSALGAFLTQPPPMGSGAPLGAGRRPGPATTPHVAHRPLPAPRPAPPTQAAPATPAAAPLPAPRPASTPRPGPLSPDHAPDPSPAGPAREAAPNVLDALKPKHRKLVEDELIADEQVLAVVNLRENQALALTGRRVIVVNGSLLFRGANAMQLADIATASSGALAIALSLRNGNECEFQFWPSGGNRAAGQTFVRKLREAQMPAPAVSAGPSTSSVADELMKLGQLRDQGLLTEQEFAAQKAALLR